MLLASSICLLRLGRRNFRHRRDHRAGHVPQLRDLHRRDGDLSRARALAEARACTASAVPPSRASRALRGSRSRARPPDETFGWLRRTVSFLRPSAGWTLAADRHRLRHRRHRSAASSRSCACRDTELLRRIAVLYIQVLQSIPVLMVLFLSYYGLRARRRSNCRRSWRPPPRSASTSAPISPRSGAARSSRCRISNGRPRPRSR